MVIRVNCWTGGDTNLQISTTYQARKAGEMKRDQRNRVIVSPPFSVDLAPKEAVVIAALSTIGKHEPVLQVSTMTRRLSGMIKQRRTESGLSQRALAKRVGVSDAYITQLETRERINPSLQVLKNLAKALQVTVVELVE